MPIMKAAVLAENGLDVRDVPAPRPKPNEILVRVRAAGLNRADLLMSSGYKHGPHGGAGTIAGLEWSGEVTEIGSEVSGFKPGDRVMCSGSGGYAEYAVADWGRTCPIPANNMSYEQAATLPVALQTMHDALVTNGRLKEGETVLIQGASTGVGLMGLQIARIMGARLVIGTSTNAERRARLKEFGADLALDSRDPGWADEVLKATDGKGVDLIVDQVSGSVANQNMKAARILGRIVNVGRLGGFKGEFDFDLHALKRIDYIGVTFRTRSIEEVRVINRLMREDLWDAVVAGKLQVPVDRVFPLDEAAAAQAHMRANNHFGKVVLAVG
jgi:NADPH2:quinone reductase